MFDLDEVKTMAKKGVLTIFYDGACGVCSTEMSYYRSIADQRISFVDIADPDFNANSYGKTIEEFQKELHVCDENYKFYTGVDAFRKLWDELPSPFYPLLSTFTGLPLVNFSARSAYALFARYRHLFPSTRKKSCDFGTHAKRG